MTKETTAVHTYRSINFRLQASKLQDCCNSKISNPDTVKTQRTAKTREKSGSNAFRTC